MVTPKPPDKSRQFPPHSLKNTQEAEALSPGPDRTKTPSSGLRPWGMPCNKASRIDAAAYKIAKPGDAAAGLLLFAGPGQIRV
jgi:hypothetical protein